MLSAVKRYRSLLAAALARYFPRTAAHLRATKEPVEPMRKPGPKAKKAATPAGKGGRKPTKKPTGSKSKAPRPTGEGIYGPAPMPVDDARIHAMRERVATAAATGLIGAPSDEQWAMILGRHPVTRIFAGAGSGKSTTLVLRVVFMLCHMGIAPERLTVISFTNASCAQLRERLIEVLAFWGYPFDEARARQCVRTFHSAMGVLARDLLDEPRWFEQLDARDGSAEPDNPFASARLRPAQLRLLKQAYQRCYAAQPDFRARVHALLDLPPPGSDAGRRAPLDGFRLAGEFAPLPLFEAFHVQAGFMESLGIRVERLDVRALACPGRERTFVEALLPFWRSFQDCLREQGLTTFNGAFQRLTESLAAGGQGVPTASLAPFTHLLIDEFQDISPQIVQWLQAVQRTLAQRGEPVSLMAIGDDWQSIYGWRGSSPELFMDFDRHFPARGRTKKSAVLTLETNYRSIEPVIRDAEAVLADVAFKQAKTSRAARAMQPGDHGVRLVPRFDLKTRLPELLAEIRAQCEHVATRQRADRNAVLLLSRSNEPLQQVQAQLDRRLPVKAYTIHRAKGLQAEVAIILDDCPPPEPHPLRNALYAHSGFFRNSYDQAMKDESLRLAYVAITRGVSRVIWFSRKPQGATRVLAERSGAHAGPG